MRKEHDRAIENAPPTAIGRALKEAPGKGQVLHATHSEMGVWMEQKCIHNTGGANHASRD